MEEFEPKIKTKILTKDFIARYAYIFVLAILLVGGISYGYTFFTENRKIASGSITTANLTINFGNREINATGLSVPADDLEGINEYSKSLTITNQTAVDGKFTLTLTRTSGIELNNLRYALVVNGAIQEINDVTTNGEILSSAIMGNDTLNVEIRLWPKTTYSESETTFVGELTPEIKYLGSTASSTSNLTGKYVNFNGNEVWQIVKVEDGRLVLTRQTDYTNATSRTNSNRYNPSLTFNDNSLITSVSTDNLNVYLAKTVKISGGSGTQASPYTLTNDIFNEEDKKVIAVITYKEDTTTVGTQNIYYNETNYISQVMDDSDFTGWTDGTNSYDLGDTIIFTTDTNLTAVIVPTLRNKIMTKCNDSAITYVQKYNAQDNGAAMDTPDGSGSEDVCYYTTTSPNRNSDAEQNANVIFGDYCWQIVRTTADGGVKLLYNGPKTIDNKCTSDADTTNYSSNPRPSSIGVVGTSGTKKTTISGSKIYGESFEIYEDGGTNKFRLKNTNTSSWSDSTYQNLIGKYVCGDSSSPTGTSDTCEVLYYVGHYQSNTQASTEKYTIGASAHYSQIGKSSFNAYNDSPALVGYMYGDVYNYKTKFSATTSNVISRTTISSNYYYGDTATWVNDHYELTMGGATPTTTTAWSSIRSSAEGMYTCLSGTSTSCASVHYIVANSSDSDMYSIILSNNETKDKTVTWHYGTSVTKVGNTYTLMDGNSTSSLTKTFKLADWYTTYNTDTGYKNIYVCDDFTGTMCTTVRFISSTSNYQETHHTLNYTYKFANDITYDTTTHEYKYDTSKTVSGDIYDWPTQYNTINNTHYTCFENYDSVNNTCGANNPIYYVYYTTNTQAYYIELTNNERIEDALQKMLNKDNSSSSLVNKYNSAIKGVIDSWYESNLLALGSYLDNNSVYCNDRTITSYGGWATNGSTENVENYLQFKYYSSPSKTAAALVCSNVTDRFSKTNAKAELTYPVGLLSEAERAMMYSGFARTGQTWWLGSPYSFGSYYARGRHVDSSGGNGATDVYSAYGLRPAIVLAPGITISSGDGTYNSPYIVDTSGN